MKTDRPIDLKAAAVLASCLLVQISAAPLLADSAVGTDTVLGDSLSVSARDSQPLDPDWLTAKHTPTGQMFQLPYALPTLDEIEKSVSGWEYSGQLEFGVIGGNADEQNAQYRMYQDVDNGAYLNNFSLQLKNPASAEFVDVDGGGAGRHDQYYGLQFGHYNSWKVKLFFNETPHVFTNEYKSLWSGIGSGNLILLPGLTPGGTGSIATDNADVAAQALKVPDTTLSLARKKAGIRVDVDLTTDWKGYVSYTIEDQKGARPYGAVWGDINSNGTAPIEVPEPVDDTTYEILAGLSYTDDLNMFNLRLSDSIYRNHVDTLTFQEPYTIPPPAGVTTVPATGAFTQGRMDLAPSNQAYNARAEYTRSFPNFYKGYFTAVVSAGKWRQDDNLIPYTTVPNLTLANVTLLPGGAWDTTGSLSRQTADADVDTRLVDLTLSINPTADLNLKLKARTYEVKNDTDPFLVVNPNAVYINADSATPGSPAQGLTLDGVTGVWGRLLNDGSGQNVLLGANATPVGNIPIMSQYTGSTEDRIGATGDYRLNRVSSLNASIEREITSWENRVRDRTWEDRAKIGYVNRGLGDTSVRLSYEFDRRRGSDYNLSSYNGAFSSALFPMPTTPGADVTTWAVRDISSLETFDIADRDQQIANLRVDTMVSQNLDAGMSLQAKDDTFPGSAYGRTSQSQGSVNFDMDYQPSPHQTIYGFYSFQLGAYRQSSITQSYASITMGEVTPLGIITPENAIEIASAPGGPEFPLANAWTVHSRDYNNVFGVGLKQEIGKANLNLDYAYSMGRTRIDYDYTVGGAISAANAVLAGTGMPDLTTETSYLDLSLQYPFTKRLSARLLCRFQKEGIRDWHYQNLATTPVVGNPNALPAAVILDGGPQDYNVHWFGIMIQIKL
jgi:hypothetical protein